MWGGWCCPAYCEGVKRRGVNTYLVGEHRGKVLEQMGVDKLVPVPEYLYSSTVDGLRNVIWNPKFVKQIAEWIGQTVENGWLQQKEELKKEQEEAAKAKAAGEEPPKKPAWQKKDKAQGGRRRERTVSIFCAHFVRGGNKRPLSAGQS